MKRIFLYSLFGFFLMTVASAQTQSTDRLASYERYGQGLSWILQHIHESTFRHELDSLRRPYTFLVHFKIDQQGKLIDFGFGNETPIPDFVKVYTQKLFAYTSGHWLPEVKNCSVVVSDTITCMMDIMKKTNTPEGFDAERSKQTRAIESTEGIPFNALTIFDSDLPNHCFVAIRY